jgi:cyclopropane-fatty-acyl-phospholipid synthase
MSTLRPFFEDIQAHYDLSNAFFFLFLDPSHVYSCAYFERDDMTLEEAQAAKLDLAFGKIDLKPGQRVLDVGCGWGAGVRRAAEKHDVHAIGLTLSRNQYDHCLREAQDRPVVRGSVEFRLQGWEQFDEKVDRVFSIGAFEHFRRARYADFFARCRSVLPPDGRMLLHTIVYPDFEREGIQVGIEHIEFTKFIAAEIFPGSNLVKSDEVIKRATAAGFAVTKVQSLQPHYAKTLDVWARNLLAHRDEAIALKGREEYERYMKYLTGCATYFRSGHIDVRQFTLRLGQGAG